jgi:hypothetical protein
VAVTFDVEAFDRQGREEQAAVEGRAAEEPDPAAVEQRAKKARALRHALAEYELRTYTLAPNRPLGEVLIG